MIFIKLILGLAALYSGGTWLWLCGFSLKHRERLTNEQHSTIELQTFHLGLCMILCLGFLGLLLR